MTQNVMVDAAENEQIVHEIRRHPVGLVPIIGTGVAVIGLMFILLISLSQYNATIAQFVPPVAVYAIIGAVMVFSLILTFIVVGIYNANELIITTENLIQVLQKTLFNRQTSHLNLADVQDVTIDKRGIFAYMFDYGNLTIETAGEAANFAFRTAKDPELAARLIVEAHEQFMKRTGIPHN